MLKGQNGFDETGSARGRFGVADLGLHRTQCAAGRVVGEHQLESGELGHVAGLRRGAVRLEQFDGRRFIAGALVGAAQCLGLTFGARRVDAGGTAIGGGADTADDRMDGIAVTFGVAEALERQHAHTLADDGAVGGVGERPAVTRRRERRRLGKAHVHHHVVQSVDAAGQHQIGFVQIQPVQRGLQCGQRTGTRGVDDEVGTAQIEAVGDTSGHDVAEQAGEGALLPHRVVVGDIATDLVRLVLGQAVFQHRLAPDRPLHPRSHLHDEFGGGGDTEDHVHPVEVDVHTAAHRLVQHLPRGDEREQLGGICRGQRVGRQPEFHRIELHRVDETAALAVGPVDGLGIGVVVVLDQPVRWRHIADRVTSAGDRSPEPLDSGLAWIDGGHPDDGNRDGDGDGNRDGGRVRILFGHGGLS